MIPLSVLDLSVVREGGTSGEALRDTTELARAADRLDFVRFWVAEHHNMATVASTSPSVLIAHLAASTERIRVGSGGVMLPNHAPLAIAEQFGLLESLHPGRIDLGIGRAPGTDPMTASVFGRAPQQSVEQFPQDLIEVMGMLGDRRRETGMWTRFLATPVLTSSPVIALLGSSGFSAQLAGMLGLPFAYAHHFDTGATDAATKLYLDHFTPSPVLDEPYLIVGVGALAAETDVEAERIGLPGRILRLGIRTNRRHPLLSTDAAAEHPDADAARRMPTDQLIGSAERVAEGLRALQTRTKASELMLTSATFDVADRVHSLELIDAARCADPDQANVLLCKGCSVVVQPSGQRRELFLLAGALVLSMSTWFSTAAVLGQLRVAWDLSSTQASWLTIVVQLGFVAGALLSAFTNLADRLPPLRLVLLGSIGAGAANTIVAAADGLAVGLVARFVTGAFLAAVYPPALKAMSSWYRTGRGYALGVMIGALTIGSALPHLINGIGGVDWRVALLIASGLTVVGGVVADRLCSPGPYSVAAARFDPSQLRMIVHNRQFRLASAGYFGHMWELYAMWAWIAAFYGDVFDSRRTASFVAFAVIAIGAAGSVHAGRMSDRRTRTEAAALAMRWSASVAVVIGFLVDAPAPIVLGAGLVWGFWVVADSAQFSTIVTEVVDARYVGTALTVQLATGFGLTVFTIFLVPVVRDAHGWGWAFLLLAPGPILGVWAMRVLQLRPQR